MHVLKAMTDTTPASQNVHDILKPWMLKAFQERNIEVYGLLQGHCRYVFSLEKEAILKRGWAYLNERVPIGQMGRPYDSVSVTFNETETHVKFTMTFE